MAKTHHAYRRLTSRYKACCDHLNEHQYLGWSFKEVTSGRVYWDVSSRGEVEYDAGYTRFLHVTTSRPVTYEEFVSALYVFQKDCACEHDCCGHFNGGARTQQVKPAGRLRGGKRALHRPKKSTQYRPRRVSGGKTRYWIVPVHYSPNL